MKWHYAATAKAIMFLTFDIDVFIVTYLDVKKNSLKVKTSRTSVGISRHAFHFLTLCSSCFVLETFGLIHTNSIYL